MTTSDSTLRPSDSTLRSSDKVLNLGTFFFLYIAQSIPVSFFSTAIQVMMRQADYSLSSIALLQLVKLPWILKFAWSPYVDRHCLTVRDYRRTILVSEVVYALLILLVGMFRLESDLYLIAVLVFLSLTASATQDIATDALATLSFKKQDKSVVNSMQTMGSFGGTLIGSGVLLVLLHNYGWQTVVPFLSVFVLLALIPLLLNRRLTITPKAPTERARPIDFIYFFTRRSIWRQVGFLVLYYAGITGTLSMLRPWLVDLGYSLKEVGFMSMLGTGAAFAISFPIGLLVRRIGRYRARLWFACFTFCTLVYFLLLSWTHPTTVALCIGYVLLWCSYSMSSVVVYTTAMDCVRPGREGTDFTVQTVITHGSSMLTVLLCGKVGDLLGFRGLFAFVVLLAGCSVAYILYFFREQKAVSQVNKDSINS
ncbi:MAG: MFS transporter [Prevotellaceae bacterium]|nr:MFS transporter [Prevotellaceae bacterium]